jgi:hypothetical protein
MNDRTVGTDVLALVDSSWFMHLLPFSQIDCNTIETIEAIVCSPWIAGKLQKLEKQFELITTMEAW